MKIHCEKVMRKILSYNCSQDSSHYLRREAFGNKTSIKKDVPAQRYRIKANRIALLLSEIGAVVVFKALFHTDPEREDSLK